jgi:hypothetical protein
MTDPSFTQADAEALAAKLEACGLTETEQRVLSVIFQRACGSGETEVEGFGFGMPLHTPFAMQIHAAANTTGASTGGTFGNNGGSQGVGIPVSTPTTSSPPENPGGGSQGIGTPVG